MNNFNEMQHNARELCELSKIAYIALFEILNL